MKKRFSDKQKVIIGVRLLMVPIFIVLLLFLLFSDLVQLQKTKIRNVLGQESKIAERIFTEKFDSTSLVMRSIANEIIKNPSSKTHINNVLLRYRNDQAFANIFSWTLFSWVDQTGQLIVDSEYGIMKNVIDISTRDYIPRSVQEPDKLHLGQPVFGSTSKIWMIPGGVGLSDSKGNYLGAITIGFSIKELAKDIYKSLNVQDVNLYLFDEKKRPVFEIVNSKLNIFSAEERENLSNVATNYNSYFKDSNSLMRGKIILAKRLENYPYSLALEYNQKAIKATFWEVFYSRIIEILLLLFGSVVLLVAVYKNEKEKRQKIAFLMHREKMASQAKTEFLLRVAHELKNFISGIKGLSSLVEEDLEHKNNETNKLLTQDSLDHLHHINEISDELGTFVDDLMDLYQVEDGSFKVIRSKAKLDLGDLIERSARFLSSKAKKKKISIEIKIAENLRSVSNLDPRRIKQILISVISNSIKFSPNLSVIKITAENLDTKKVIIKVKDTGLGMTEAEINSAFKIYEPGTGDGSENIDSVELKLPVVSFLLKQQEGELNIISEKNFGTEVRIILP